MISCLMVTLGSQERFNFLQAAISSFQRQTFRARELLIVTNGGERGDRQRIVHYVITLEDPSIRVMDIDGTLSLGALRNRSVECAKGEVFCQWDDDDLYHPQRLEHQFRALTESGGNAVFLRDVMLFDAESRRLYCTNWHATEGTAFPGSLMCRKSADISYPERGTEARMGEDSAVSRQLLAQGGVNVLSEMPHLYIYVAHGRNTWHEDHHRMLVRELAISRGLLLRREALLRQGLEEIDFGAGKVVVEGANGPAFVL